MLFKNIAILDENYEIKESRYVGTEKDKIAYIGTETPETDFGEVYDGKNKLLMPAFFNAHAHSPMMLMRGGILCYSFGDGRIPALRDRFFQRYVLFLRRYGARCRRERSKS